MRQKLVNTPSDRFEPRMQNFNNPRYVSGYQIFCKEEQAKLKINSIEMTRKD